MNVNFDILKDEDFWRLKEFIEEYTNEFQKTTKNVTTKIEQNLIFSNNIESNFNFNQPKNEKNEIHSLNPLYNNQIPLNQYIISNSQISQRPTSFKWNFPQTTISQSSSFIQEKERNEKTNFHESDFTEKFFNEKFFDEENPKKRNLEEIEFFDEKNPKKQKFDSNSSEEQTKQIELLKEPSKKFTITIELVTIEKNEKDNLYHCEICQKGYKDRSNLVKHLRIHTKEKPFECEICGKEFAHSQSKNDHMNIHKQKKPYQCTECEKTFANGSNLRRHLNGVHKEEKKHKCEYCDQKFSQKTNLNSHVKKFHSIPFLKKINQ